MSEEEKKVSLEILQKEIHDLQAIVTALNDTVRSQEHRLFRLEGKTSFSELPSISTTASEHISSNVSSESPLPPPPPRYEGAAPVETVTGSAFGEWFRVDWPMKVGALLILLGFGWFVSYAFMNNWIGPVGRIAFGILAGVVLLAFGHLRMRMSLNQGGVLLGLGTAMTLLTIFAARELYDFFTPILAIVFMSLVVVFTAYSSLVFKSRAIALMSLVAGSVAPLLTAGESNFLGLFSYLFLLSAGTLWVVRLTAWRILTFISLLFVSLYSLVFIVAGMGHGVERWEAILVAVLFATLYFVTGLFGTLKDRMLEQSDIFVVALNGFLFLGWIHSFVPDYLQSITVTLAAVVMSVAATIVYRISGIVLPVYLYSGSAIVFFIAATAYELSGAVFIIALALEMGLIIASSFLFLHNVALSKKLGWLMALPVIFSMESIGNYSRVLRYDFIGRTSTGTSWYDGGVFTSDFFAILTMFAVSVGIAYLYWIAEASMERGKRVTESRFFLALSMLYAVFLIWFMFKRAIVDEDIAVMLALTVYTVAGVGLYLKGRFSQVGDMQVFGSALLILVAARLILVEVWNMDIFGRIVTFFVIGTLFMSTAFLGRRKKEDVSSLSSGTIAGVMFLLSCVLAPSVNAASSVNMESTGGASELSAFEYVEPITIPLLKVPSVVEVPISDPMIRKGSFAIWEESTGTFQPSAYRSVKKPASVQAFIPDGAAEGLAENLVDGNFQTAVTFPVRNENEKNVVEIHFKSVRPVSLSGITLVLDRYVSLPKSMQVLRRDGGQEKIVLAETAVTGQVIRFPKETGTEWLVRFSYAQPLRLLELSLLDESAPLAEREAVRFLARPGESYVLYFGADRPVVTKTGEAPNLLDDHDVLIASVSKAEKNPLYVPADTDGDGVRDLFDNCVSTPNPDQSDANGNGRGDICDDYDKDGVVNAKDNCPNHPNRNQIDTDGDGEGDACDGEESRITEKYVWLPWVAMVVAGLVVAGLFAATVRRERNKK